tara:strand:+ start:1172 stop:1384 length:213 start_codon:yes stop_codon:yes gene_type:complete
MAKISHSNPDLDDVYIDEEEVIEVQEPITWQQIEQLNLSYGTLLEIIAELVNGETSIEDAREKILDGELD